MRTNPPKEFRKLTISLETDLADALNAERVRIGQETGLPSVSMNAVISRALRAGLASCRRA